jgi:hypothetical protein
MIHNTYCFGADDQYRHIDPRSPLHLPVIANQSFIVIWYINKPHFVSGLVPVSSVSQSRRLSYDRLLLRSCTRIAPVSIHDTIQTSKYISIHYPLKTRRALAYRVEPPTSQKWIGYECRPVLSLISNSYMRASAPSHMYTHQRIMDKRIRTRTSPLRPMVCFGSASTLSCASMWTRLLLPTPACT